MAENIGVFYGSSSGSGIKFRVACELQYTDKDDSKGFFFQKRYYLDVTVASKEEIPNVYVSWGSVPIKIKDIGYYAISEWIDVGWKKSKSTIDCSCNAKVIIKNTTYTSTCSTKYEVFVERYTVNYSGNGGTRVPSTQNFDKDKSITLSTLIPLYPGYKFLYWNTRPDGYGVSYNPGDIYKQNASITLYAIWEIAKVNVIFYKNDGSGETKEQTFTYGLKDQKFTENRFERDGYILINYRDSNDKIYDLDFKVTDSWIESVDRELKLYARWSQSVGGILNVLSTDGIRKGKVYVGNVRSKQTFICNSNREYIKSK